MSFNLNLKFLKYFQKTKKITKAILAILTLGIFGGIFITLLAILLRKKRKK